MRSKILKIALFATGVSGIVAEYILSTLATYFLGDSVMQWTLIVSVMLFSMGLGSRLSQYFNQHLLQRFIQIEFLLSILVGFSSLITYSAASFTIYNGLIIYSMSILIGILIGMEIPLAVRVNEEFEELRINVSSVIEKDYYGSLAGGLFFAFVGLPYLGLSYTPFILAFINFSVAVWLLGILWQSQTPKAKKLNGSLAALTLLLLVVGLFLVEPIILYGEQNKYKDKIVYQEQSRYQKIVITQWKNHYWLYLNSHQQLSTVDEVMYHEPLVHPAMKLSYNPRNILIMGGGDGCAAREVLKYPTVESIKLVDLDKAVTDLSATHPVLTQLNRGSLSHPLVEIINTDAYHYLDTVSGFFDAIIIDLPDPKSVEMGRLYSKEFYLQCYRHLTPNGTLVTQAGSPYFATRAFRCIDTTMQEAGFTTLPYHNQIVTMGEWAWVLGSKWDKNRNDLQNRLLQQNFDTLQTQWLNNQSISAMTSWGKNIYPNADNRPPQVNRIHNPVLYKYYLNGNWDLY